MLTLRKAKDGSAIVMLFCTYLCDNLLFTFCHETNVRSACDLQRPARVTWSWRTRTWTPAPGATRIWTWSRMQMARRTARPTTTAQTATRRMAMTTREAGRWRCPLVLQLLLLIFLQPMQSACVSYMAVAKWEFIGGWLIRCTFFRYSEWQEHQHMPISLIIAIHSITGFYYVCTVDM